MGGVILTSELEIPYLEQEKIEIEEQIQRITKLKTGLKNSGAQGLQLQAKLLALSNQEKTLKSQEQKITNKVLEFQKQEPASLSFESMLPIDYSQSDLDYRYRSDESENMHFIILKRQSTQEQIDNFADHLTQMRYLPGVIDLIKQISGTILKQTQGDQEVCLLGSFITLPHVRVMDPIVIRKDAVLDERLMNPTQAAKYSVITEAVLGGVFIGFGSTLSKASSEDSSNKTDVQSLTSSMRLFSFVSQGAIPSTDHFNLWDTYNSWKKRLTSERHCGFPIAFKVRRLIDVMRENGYNLT
jgi:hypothetical protein